MAEIYDTTRFGELYYSSKNPPVDNLGIAAKYVYDLMSGNNVPTAVLGGWALFLRGSSRSTTDIDITVRSSMDNLLALLKQDKRLCLPLRYGPTCLTIFVHTGGAWDPGLNPIPIYVDLIIGGNLGTPANMPEGTDIITPVPKNLNISEIRVIDLAHQFSAKLFAFSNRQSENDFNDLVFLLTDKQAEIHGLRDQFDVFQRQFFLYAFAARNPGQDKLLALVMQILGIQTLNLAPSANS